MFLARFCSSVRLNPKRFIPVVLGIFTLLLTCFPYAVGAEISPFENTSKAPVVMDGEILFKVAGSTNEVATERAEIINETLRGTLRNLRSEGQAPQVEIKREDDWWTLRHDGQHLLTVTAGDVLSGANPYRRAKTWQTTIQEALERGLAERSSIYVQQALLFSALVLFGALLLQCGLWWLGQWLPHQLRHWLKHPSVPIHPWEKPIKLFLQLGIMGLQMVLWLSILAYVTDLFPQLRSGRYQLMSSLTAQVISFGDETRYSALELLLLLALTVGLWFAVSALTRLFKGYVLRHTGADLGMQQVVAVLMQYILTFLGLIILLQVWGIDVASLAIFASVLGVGIGFGIQNITNDFISGVIITLERPIQGGDFIKVGNLLGTVKQIGARSTSVLTLDKVMIIVPNSRFLQDEVINWSHSDPVSRLQIPVGVAYGSNIDKVKAALLDAARSHPEVLMRPWPEVRFEAFGDSALNFLLLVWIGDPKRQPKIKSDLNYRIADSLARYRLEVPFPQRDLHVRSPQLQELVDALRQQHALPNSNANQRPASHSKGEPNREYPDHGPALQDGTPAQLTLINSPLDLESDEFITDEINVDLNVLVAAMRGPEGLEIKDRFYRLNLYPKCFVGKDAVAWMVGTQNLTREAAIDVGQTLIEHRIIHHVLDENAFQDDYLFYRFYRDE